MHEKITKGTFTSAGGQHNLFVDHNIVLLTFSLCSTLMMEQFKIEGSCSLGMVITLATVCSLGDVEG